MRLKVIVSCRCERVHKLTHFFAAKKSHVTLFKPLWILLKPETQCKLYLNPSFYQEIQVLLGS